MTTEELIKLYPQLSKIGFFEYSQIIHDRYNIEFDSNKTWEEMGLDELDTVELIIDLEKMFEELIPDMSEEEAGQVIADALVDEFNKFFSNCFQRSYI